MAVVNLATIWRFLGLSTDTKPTTGVPAGSTFYETDSGAAFIYNGSAWSVRPDAGPFRGSKTVTFTGAANLGQAGTNTILFTVTGEVEIVSLVAFCTTLLTEALATATISLGVTGSVALFIAATNSVDIDANEFWVDITPDPNGIAIPAALKNIAITDDILAAAAVQNTNGGVIRFDCYWRPISANGLLVPA